VNPRWLRPGDLLAGGGGVLVLVSLFLPWSSVTLPSADAPALGRELTGWQAFSVIDLLLALVGLVGIGVALTTATRRTPALPLAVAVIASTTGVLAVLLVLVRILDQPGPNQFLDVSVGAWLALAGTLGLTGGAWRSIADERNRGVQPAPVELRPAPPAG
jgi:hypothetical protein